MKKPSILVTGAAGFIGFHLCARLLRDGYTVYGLDNLNAYYDPALKQARLELLQARGNFIFSKTDLADHQAVDRLFAEWKPEIVVNLAAQAGVRYSLEQPRSYISSNIDGFLNVLEACRHHGVGHLVFASSSSVYGANKKLPFATTDNVDLPINLYAATKKANELMAHSYAHLFRFACTGLRFFTVYGPWGRPDMALFKFTKALYEGRAIDVYNHGDMHRDFTYVDDIVEGIVRLLPRYGQSFVPAPEAAAGAAPYRIYNIGNNRPEHLMEAIRLLEQATGCTAKLNMMPLQPGDVISTYADVDDLSRDTGFAPVTPLKTGIENFVSWYRMYHGLEAEVLKKASKAA